MQHSTMHLTRPPATPRAVGRVIPIFSESRFAEDFRWHANDDTLSTDSTAIVPAPTHGAVSTRNWRPSVLPGDSVRVRYGPMAPLPTITIEWRFAETVRG